MYVLPISVWFGSQFRGRGPGSRAPSRVPQNPAARRVFTGHGNMRQQQFNFRRGATSFPSNVQQQQPSQRFTQGRQDSLFQPIPQQFQNPNRGFQASFQPRDVFLQEFHQPSRSSRVSLESQRQRLLTRQPSARVSRPNTETVRRALVRQNPIQTQGQTQSQIIGHNHIRAHGHRQIHIPRVNTIQTNTRHAVASNMVHVRVPTTRVGHIGNVAVVRSKAGVSQGRVVHNNVAAHRPKANHHGVFVRPLQRQAIVVPEHPLSHSQPERITVAPKVGTPIAIHTQRHHNQFAGHPKVVVQHPQVVQSTVAHGVSNPKINVAQSEIVQPVASLPVAPSVQVIKPKTVPKTTKIPVVASVPVLDTTVVAQSPIAAVGQIITEPKRTVGASVKVETPVLSIAPVAKQTPAPAVVPVVSKAPAEPTLEEDLQLIQSVIALLQTSGVPSAMSGIPQTVAAPVPQVNQFGTAYWPGMMNPWAAPLYPGFMQELFGDSTDPPDPISTTTMAPKVTTVNTTEPIVNETTVTVVAKEVVHEQIPAPQGEGTTLAPEIVKTSLVKEKTISVEPVSSAEQLNESSITDTKTVKAEVKTKVTIDTNAGEKVPKLTVEPLPDNSTELKEQVIDAVIRNDTTKVVTPVIGTTSRGSSNLITIITDALQAASYPVALQEKLLEKLSTVVSQTSLKPERKPKNEAPNIEIKLPNNTIIKTEPISAVTDTNKEAVKVSQESFINIESNNPVADSGTVNIKVSKEIKSKPKLAVTEESNKQLNVAKESAIAIESNSAAADSNIVKVQISNETGINSESKGTKIDSKVVKLKIPINEVDSKVKPIDKVVDIVAPGLPTTVDVVTEIPIDMSIRTDRLPTAADLGIVINYNSMSETTKAPEIKIKNPIEKRIKDKVLALVRYITNKKRAQLPNVIVVKQAPVTVITKERTIKDDLKQAPVTVITKERTVKDDLKQAPVTVITKERTVKDDLKQAPVTVITKERTVKDDLKQAPVTVITKEHTIKDDLKQAPVTGITKERTIQDDLKQAPVTVITKERTIQDDLKLQEPVKIESKLNIDKTTDKILNNDASINIVNSLNTDINVVDQKFHRSIKVELKPDSVKTTYKDLNNDGLINIIDSGKTHFRFAGDLKLKKATKIKSNQDTFKVTDKVLSKDGSINIMNGGKTDIKVDVIIPTDLTNADMSKTIHSAHEMHHDQQIKTDIKVTGDRNLKQSIKIESKPKNFKATNNVFNNDGSNELSNSDKTDIKVEVSAPVDLTHFDTRNKIPPAYVMHNDKQIKTDIKVAKERIIKDSMKLLKPVKIESKDFSINSFNSHNTDSKVADDRKLQKPIKIETTPDVIKASNKVLKNDGSINLGNKDKTEINVEVSVPADLAHFDMRNKMPPAYSMHNDKQVNEIAYNIKQSAKDTTEFLKKASIKELNMKVDSKNVGNVKEAPIVSDINTHIAGVQFASNNIFINEKGANEVIKNTNLPIEEKPLLQLMHGVSKIKSVVPAQFSETHLLKEKFSVTKDSELNTEMPKLRVPSDTPNSATTDILLETPNVSGIIPKNNDVTDNALTNLANSAPQDNNIIAILDITPSADVNVETTAQNVNGTDNNVSKVHQEIPIYMADALLERVLPPHINPTEANLKPTHHMESVSVKDEPLVVAHIKVERPNKDAHVQETLPIPGNNQEMHYEISSQPTYIVDTVPQMDTSKVSTHQMDTSRVSTHITDTETVSSVLDKQHSDNESQIIEGIPVDHVTDLRINNTAAQKEVNINNGIAATVDAIARAAGKPALEIVLESLAGQSGLGPGVQFLSRPVHAVDPSIINQLTALPNVSGVKTPDVKHKPIEQQVLPSSDKHTVVKPELPGGKTKEAIIQSNTASEHSIPGLNMTAKVFKKGVTDVQDLKIKPVPPQESVDPNVKAEVLNVNITTKGVNQTAFDTNKSPHISNDSVLNNIDLASLAKELKLISNGTDITSYLSDPLFVSVLEDIVNQTLHGAAGANTDMMTTEIPMNTEMTSTEVPFMTSTETFMTSTESFMTTTEEPPEIEIEDITTTALPTTTAPTTTVKPTKKPKRKRPIRRKWGRRRVKG